LFAFGELAINYIFKWSPDIGTQWMGKMMEAAEMAGKRKQGIL
jgi:hypothetical protein